MSPRDLVFGVVSGVIAVVLTCACSPKGGKAAANSSAAPIITDCELPSAQQFSIQGRWAAPNPPPIKISFHNGDFGAAEVSFIQAAGATWNAFFTASKGFSIFDMGPAGGNNSAASQTTPSNQGSTIPDGTVLYKRFSNWTHSARAIAVTTTAFVSSSNGNLPRIYNAIMEFNYVNFFVQQSNQFPDMQSVALHEMGHLLGLDHSCGPLGAPNQNEPDVACPSQATDPGNLLFSTVMFPNFFFSPVDGTSNVQTALSLNDEGRANCAYNNGQTGP